MNQQQLVTWVFNRVEKDPANAFVVVMLSAGGLLIGILGASSFVRSFLGYG